MHRSETGARVTPPRAAVIGGGWAGLAAAAVLSDQSLPVTVFESSRTPGGRARKVALNGLELDNGQHILLGAYRQTLDLMRLVGADADKVLLRLPLDLRFAAGFHLRMRRLPYPFNALLGLFSAKGLSLSEAMAAVRLLMRLKRRHFQLECDRSVSQLIEEEAQPDPLRRFLWEPLCVSALNTGPEQASAQVFLNVIRDALAGPPHDSDLLLPATDLGSIFPEPACEFIRRRGGSIELGQAVRRIERRADGFSLDGQSPPFTHVILACAPQHAIGLMKTLPELDPMRRAMEAFAYEPIVTCYLQYPQDVRLAAPMLGLSDGMVQWVFDRARLGGKPGLLAAVISGSGPHQQLSAGELADRIHAEIAAAVGTLPEPSWSRVINEKRATFSCRVALERPGAVTAVPRLFLAGDYVASDYPGTLEAAVRSGVAAARTLIQSLQPGQAAKRFSATAAPRRQAVPRQ